MWEYSGEVARISRMFQLAAHSKQLQIENFLNIPRYLEVDQYVNRSGVLGSFPHQIPQGNKYIPKISYFMKGRGGGGEWGQV